VVAPSRSVFDRDSTPPDKGGIRQSRAPTRAAVKGGQRPAERTLEGCVLLAQRIHNGVGRSLQRPACVPPEPFRMRAKTSGSVVTPSPIRGAKGADRPAETAAKPPSEGKGRLDSVEKDCHNWDRISVLSQLVCWGLEAPSAGLFCPSVSRPVSSCLTLFFRAVRCRAVMRAIHSCHPHVWFVAQARVPFVMLPPRVLAILTMVMSSP
jgi:hypothetical protein